MAALTKTSSTEIAENGWRRPDLDRALDERGPLTQNGALVPAEYCRQVVSMPDDPPCGPAVGAKLAMMLIGSYPQRKAADPETYAAAITSMFAEFPKEVGRAAILHLIRTKTFFPVPADVYGACGAILGAERYRRTRAKQILTEHARRAEEAKRQQIVARDREKIAAKIARYGSPAERLARELEEKAGAEEQQIVAPNPNEE